MQGDYPGRGLVAAVCGVMSLVLSCGGEAVPPDQPSAASSVPQDPPRKPSGEGARSNSQGPVLPSSGSAGLGGSAALSSGGEGSTAAGGSVETPAGISAVCVKACKALGTFRCDGSDDKTPCEVKCEGAGVDEACRHLQQAVYECAGAHYPASVRCDPATGPEFVCGVCDSQLKASAVAGCLFTSRCVF